MTSQQKIVALSVQGLTNREIAERIGCRIEYVRVAKRRAQLAQSRTAQPLPLTMHQRIVALVVTGASDVEVAERLGCSRPYVRLVRQRAGLAVPRGTRRNRSPTRAERTILGRISRLQDQLKAARVQLRHLRANRASTQQLQLL